MGRGRPGASGCNREDAQRSGALVEVEPVCVTPNDDETACRSSVASLGRRQPSRPSRSLAVQGRDVYDDEYFRILDRETRPILERQLSRAITGVASMIYGAWDAAGRPELPVDPPRELKKVKR